MKHDKIETYSDVNSPVYIIVNEARKHKCDKPNRNLPH